jgi:hypothetical protein
LLAPRQSPLRLKRITPDSFPTLDRDRPATLDSSSASSRAHLLRDSVRDKSDSNAGTTTTCSESALRIESSQSH